MLRDDLVPSFDIKYLTLTFRYTDWWHWETNSSLYFMPKPPTAFKLPQSLEEFVLELETRNGNRDELNRLVEQECLDWEFNTLPKGQDPNWTPVKYVFKYAKRSESTWIGSATIDGKSHIHHTPERNDTPKLPDTKMQYYVVKLTYTKQLASKTTIQHIDLSSLNL